jgi:hypothetical protein
MRAGGAELGLVGFDDFEPADLLGVSVVAASPEAMAASAQLEIPPSASFSNAGGAPCGNRISSGC